MVGLMKDAVELYHQADTVVVITNDFRNFDLKKFGNINIILLKFDGLTDEILIKIEKYLFIGNKQALFFIDGFHNAKSESMKLVHQIRKYAKFSFIFLFTSMSGEAQMHIFFTSCQPILDLQSMKLVLTAIKGRTVSRRLILSRQPKDSIETLNLNQVSKARSMERNLKLLT